MQRDNKSVRMCIQVTTKAIYNKRRCKLAYHVTRSNNVVMCSGCKRKRVCCSYRYPWSFSTCWYGRDSASYIRIEVSEAIAILEPATCSNYLWHNWRVKAMLYVQLKKDLYGTLQAALLFWKLLSNTLQEWGFKINDYERCISNKMINGKQCTIIWHVDDLKISHEKKAVVEDLLKN